MTTMTSWDDRGRDHGHDHDLCLYHETLRLSLNFHGMSSSNHNWHD